MIAVLLAALGGLVAGAAGARGLSGLTRRRTRRGAGAVRRILLPFGGPAVPRRAIDAAVRLARAEGAILMPAFLATVPRHLPLDAPLPRQSAIAMPVLEALEQVAGAQDVEVDARIGRGRSPRHALARLLEDEQVDRVVVAAADHDGHGLGPSDLEWLLRSVDAEVVVLRPGPDDHRAVSGAGVVGHF